MIGVGGQKSVEKCLSPEGPLVPCGVICLYPVSRGMVKGVSSLPGFICDVTSIGSADVGESGGSEEKSAIIEDA